MILFVRPGVSRKAKMGTWGTSPFGSDTALDLLVSVRSMQPDERVEFVARILESGNEPDPDISDVLPEEVIAAAAIVAANLAGGEALSWNEDVENISEWLPRPVSSNLAALAIDALDATISANSWWWQSWVDDLDRAQVEVSLERVRTVLRGRR